MRLSRDMLTRSIQLAEALAKTAKALARTLARLRTETPSDGPVAGSKARRPDPRSADPLTVARRNAALVKARAAAAAARAARRDPDLFRRELARTAPHPPPTPPLAPGERRNPDLDAMMQ